MSLQPGTVLGPYEIVGSLGAGGMGEVYRARDTKLNRDVALKFLQADSASWDGRERLLREARAASTLNHPSICTIYEISEHEGQPFIAMECLEGETLMRRLERGAVEGDAAVEFAAQIADALDMAHSKGIVHRDLKPANLFITTRGDVKVLDFGLAKVLGQEHAATMAPGPQLTAPGSAVGTIAYMAPEQARGEAVDARSDLFALGVVLYELATGRRAFAASTTALTFDAILNRQPPPLTTHRNLPAELDRIVTRLLAKEPAGRYQSAREVRDDLRALRRGLPQHDSQQAALAALPSVAVLPFNNLSPDPENDYFADGVTEEMISALGQLDGLRVTGRTSSFAFKGRTPDLGEIAAKLKVASVLTGSVRRAGSRLRISVELVNVADGFQLWSERYDRQADDIFAIQDEIAAATANKLRVSLGTGSSARPPKRVTENRDAYELYLKGRVLLNQRGRGIPVALECFQGALALDPEYAAAHAGIADAYTLLTFYGAMPLWQGMPKAKDAARRAIAIDPLLADPHAALYYVYYCTEWDFAAAANEIAAAMRLDRKLVTALNWHSFFLAAGEGRVEEAAAIAGRAAESDPLAAYPMVLLGNCHWFARRLVEAETAMQRALEIEPLLWSAWRNLGILQALRGKHAEGIATLERAIALSDRHTWVVITLADALSLAGRIDEARRLHDEVVQRARTSYVQSIWLGYSHSIVGDLDGAFAAFDQAERDREALPLLNHLWYMAREARKDPRFAALMRRAGVTPAPDLIGR